MAGKGQLRVRVVGDTSDLKKSLKGAGGAIGKFAKVGGAAVGAAAAFSVKSFADFDQALNKSVSIMGNVSDAMRGDMSDAAREVAKTTTFSAEQAAESYFFLASAGFDAKESIGALPRVAKFAQAGNFDMATATDLATDAQSALGMTSQNTEKNLAGLNRTMDVFAAANNLANASVEQFATSMTRKAGGALKNINKDIEEGTAVLGVFADAGIKGERAGTILSNVLDGLTRNARDNADAFEEFGVSVFDSQGKVRHMADITAELEDAFSGMTEEQKLAAISQLGFTKETSEGIMALLGNSEALREYDKELRNAGGTVDEVAEKQLDTFWAQLGLLKDQIVDVAIEIGQTLTPHLRNFVDLIQRHMPTIKAFVENALDAIGDVISNRVVPAVKQVIEFGRELFEEFRSGQSSMTNLIDAFVRIGNTLATFLPQIIEFGRRLIELAGPAVQKIAGLIMNELVPAFSEFFQIIQPVLSFLLNIVGDALIGAFNGLVQAVSGVLNIIIGLFETFVGIFTGDWSRAWEGIKQIGQGIWDAILGAFKVWWNVGILKFVTVGLKGLLKLFTGGWKQVVKIFKKAWNGLDNLVKSGVKTIVGWIRGFKDTIVSFFSAAGRWLVSGGKKLMSGLRSGITSRWRSVRGWFRDLPGKIKNFFSNVGNWLLSRGKSLLTGFRSGIIERYRDVRSWFRELPGKILGIFAHAGSWLINAGKAVIDGLWEGIQSGFGKIKDGLGWLGDQIGGWKGPESYDRTILRPAGEAIIDGLNDGLRSRFATVRATLQELTRDIARQATPVERAASSILDAIKGGKRIGEDFSFKGMPDFLKDDDLRSKLFGEFYGSGMDFTGAGPGMNRKIREFLEEFLEESRGDQLSLADSLASASELSDGESRSMSDRGGSTTITLETAPGGDSAVATMIDSLIRQGIIRLRVSGNTVRVE